MGKPRVAFVNMPFSAIYRPALGLSLLKSALERDGFMSDIYYLNLLFAQAIGEHLYNEISDTPPTSLLGEWMFSQALFGPNPEMDQEYVNQVLPGHPSLPRELFEQALSMRERVESFLDQSIEAIPWSQYQVVGFTSSFQQTVPALALAKRLKANYPDLLIAMGGANLEGVMGHAILRSFPFVDFVCSGEGDLSVPEVIRRLSAGEPLTGVPGITFGSEAFTFGEVSRLPVHDMDALPTVNYDDYFSQRSQLGIADQHDTELNVLFETSRGCWWGAKSHCKFCGLNGSTLTYRAKSGERALAEIRDLRARYGNQRMLLSAVDNILPMNYFTDVIPALIQENNEVPVFYETKANLTREQIKLMADANFFGIQPGIESLSTSVLRLMAKGVSGLQNIQLLKWSKEYGLQVFWNYLTGFPGEEPGEYDRIAQIIPALTHLQPPQSHARLRLDRFSPYFERAADHGVINVQPVPAYGIVFWGVEPDMLKHLAYYFHFDYADGRDVASYTSSLMAAMKDWQEARGSELFSVLLGEQLVIFDMRPAAVKPTHKLTGAKRLVYEYCDATRSRQSIATHLLNAGYALLEDEIDEMIEELSQDLLVFADGGLILSLAIPLGEFSPGQEGAERFLQFLEEERQKTGQLQREETRLLM